MHLSSPGTFDDLCAFFFLWCERPEDRQVDVGKAVGISEGDRPFYRHGCYFWVSTVVRRKFLRQGKSPGTFFMHNKTSSLPSSVQQKAQFLHQLFTNARNAQSPARAKQNQPSMAWCAPIRR